MIDKLKHMKKISGKTSQQISDETGIPKSTIDKLFSGQTKEPYLQSTRSIVHAMGFTLDDLDDTIIENAPIDMNKDRLLRNYEKLNDIGKGKLLEYSDDLINLGKYTVFPKKEKHA